MIRQQEPRDSSHELFPTLIESYIGILNCALSFTLHQVLRWKCVCVICVCVCVCVHTGDITSATGCAAPTAIFIILSHYLCDPTLNDCLVCVRLCVCLVLHLYMCV